MSSILKLASKGQALVRQQRAEPESVWPPDLLR
jgi:hypothetical protein